MIQREGAGHKLPTPVHQVENSRSEHRALLPLTSLHNSQIISPLGRRLTHTRDHYANRQPWERRNLLRIYIYTLRYREKRSVRSSGRFFPFSFFSFSSLPFPTPSPDTDGRRVFYFSYIYFSPPPLYSVNMHPRRDERRYQTEKNYL